MTAQWVSEVRKGVIELCVLGALRRGERYGYEVATALKDLPSMTIKDSTLYLILARLEREGLIRARAAPSPKGPTRRYFAITKTGEARLHEMTDFWRVVCDDVDRVLEADET